MEDTSDIMSYPITPVSKETADLIYCVFNQGVNCYDKTGCSKCGWNPAVSEMRLRRMFPERAVKIGG